MDPREVKICLLALLSAVLFLNHLYGTAQYIALGHQARKRKRIVSLILSKRRQIMKSGISCHRLLEMDSYTLRRHIRMDSEQFETFINFLDGVGQQRQQRVEVGRPKIPTDMRAMMFLWYMANNNSFREISDKFNVTESSAHRTITRILNDISHLSSRAICWPREHAKMQYACEFQKVCGLGDIIGAIDGCHIRIIKPERHGDSYLNRKGYHSILLQGVCNHKGKFIDIFVGPPGRVHDARLLRHSDLFNTWEAKLGNRWKLLGDSAYISRQFPFIVTPKRDNGILSAADIHNNACISRGRVAIENAFGRLKCRWRRIRDIQNVRLDIVVRLVIAACTLHNVLTKDRSDLSCEAHPDGCPRRDDANEE